MTEHTPSIIRSAFLPTFLRHWAAKDFWPVEENFGSSEAPQYTLSEDEDHLYLEVAMPGIKAEDIQLTYDKGVARISAQRKHKEEDKARKYYQRAQYNYSFCFALPSSNLHEGQEPKASYENGMLTISFAKARKEEPRRIAVKSS